MPSLTSSLANKGCKSGINRAAAAASLCARAIRAECKVACTADYARRAAVAYFGLGANVPEDAIYPAAFTDSDGKPLDSAAKYMMHFDKENLPPVRAFWSLTMYNDRQFFTANPINRFAIGDRDALKYNADGSLDLYIQREAPAADKTSNWLPAPASGGFTMNLRLYWPKSTALEGTWAAAPVKRQE